MRNLAHYALSIGAAIAFAGCSGSRLAMGAPGAMPQAPAPGTAATSSQVPRGHGVDDMEALFYAFGGDNGLMAIFKVTFEARPQLLKLVSIPYMHLYGSCSDPSGHVFVTQHDTSGPGDVIEFAHASTSAVATLTDTGVASACAYDRTTGNLAVANSYDADAPGGPGPDIAVYTKETGTPTLYADPLSDSISSCSYDPSGNLFIGGVMRHGTFVLTELPRSSTTMRAITIDERIGGEHRRQDVQWHHGSLFVTSVDSRRDHGTHLYVLSISGSTATVKATIKLHTVNGNEKATGPWMVLFAGYAVTTDKIGVSGFRIPLNCTGTCVLHRGDRHLLRVADGFTSVTASAIRSHEGKI